MNRVAVLLAFVAMVAGVVYLGWVQNSQRFTQLSINLGPVGAWQLARPVSVPALIASCFGVGFGTGALAFIGNAMRLSRRVRRLEQQVAVSGSEDTSNDWS